MTGRDIREAIDTFGPTETALETVCDNWDGHWSHGCTSDPALDSMLETAADFHAKASQMLRILQEKRSEWRKHALGLCDAEGAEE